MVSNRAAELPIAVAEAEAAVVAARLLAMAVAAEQQATAAVRILRHWEAAAGTFTYHTHARLACNDPQRLPKISDCFFHAATLPAQPWYTQFVGGEAQPVTPCHGAVRACLNVPRFDFGLGKIHSYRQLLTEFQPDGQTRVLVLRSVAAPMPFPPASVPAYTLAPTGDVLRWVSGMLHWHHICTVTGVGLMPERLERPLMNLLRWCRLDFAERKTYREEAGTFIRWAQDAAEVSACHAAIPPQRLP